MTSKSEVKVDRICWNCYSKHQEDANFCTPECKKDWLINIAKQARQYQKELKDADGR